MTATSGTTIVTDAVTAFGTQAIVVLGATVAVATGLLVFYFGWKKLRGAAR